MRLVRQSDLGTAKRSLAKTTPQSSGERGNYSGIKFAPGEAHCRREDLGKLGDDTNSTVLGRFIHITDFQLVDPASPGRLDFLQRFAGMPGWFGMAPSYRPQEWASLHAFEAMMRTLRTLSADIAAAGEPAIDLVLTTGDNADSAQHNEVGAFLGIMEGASTIDPSFGVSDTRAIPSCLPSSDFYHAEPGSDDVYRQRYGFPDRPGALSAALQSFTTEGLGLPWLGCFGNHDCLAQGRAVATPEFQRLVTGTRRPIARPSNVPASGILDAYCKDPTVMSGGESIEIEPDAERAVMSRADYIQAHLNSTSMPAGHGFSQENLDQDTAYFSYDKIPGTRIIVLDSTNPAGYFEGSIGEQQYQWLERQLVEVHSEYLDAEGATIRTGSRNRLVIVTSHHGASTMTNDAQLDDETNLSGSDRPRHLGPDVEQLLHRFPNVVLWVSGHTHRNLITARPGTTGGYFEIVTSALAEWPSQARLIDIELHGAGSEAPALLVRTTMVDHAAPVSPSEPWDLWNLASLHREISANEVDRVAGEDAPGGLQDRNVELVIPVGADLATDLAAEFV